MTKVLKEGQTSNQQIAEDIAELANDLRVQTITSMPKVDDKDCLAAASRIKAAQMAGNRHALNGIRDEIKDLHKLADVGKRIAEVAKGGCNEVLYIVIDDVQYTVDVKSTEDHKATRKVKIADMKPDVHTGGKVSVDKDAWRDLMEISGNTHKPTEKGREVIALIREQSESLRAMGDSELLYVIRDVSRSMHGESRCRDAR